MAEDPKEEQRLAERLAGLPVDELGLLDLILQAPEGILLLGRHEQAAGFLVGIRNLLDRERCRRRLAEEAEQAELERWAELP